MDVSHLYVCSRQDEETTQLAELWLANRQLKKRLVCSTCGKKNIDISRRLWPTKEATAHIELSGFAASIDTSVKNYNKILLYSMSSDLYPNHGYNLD